MKRLPSLGLKRAPAVPYATLPPSEIELCPKPQPPVQPWPAVALRPLKERAKAPAFGLSAPLFLGLRGGRLPSASLVPKLSAELAFFQYKKSFFRVVFSHLAPSASRPSLTPRLSPFLELTTPLTLAAAEVAPAYRHASIARSLTAQAVRRALILIQPLALGLTLKGAMPGFSSL